MVGFEDNHWAKVGKKTVKASARQKTSTLVTIYGDQMEHRIMIPSLPVSIVARLLVKDEFFYTTNMALRNITREPCFS
jgi:hypothetical protein